MTEARVIGAGLSGLAAAWTFAEAGAAVTVYDAAPRAGGLLRTTAQPEGLVEEAARAFVWSDRVGALFTAAGVTPQHAEERSKSRYIFRNGRPRRWPLRVGESLSLAGRAGVAFVTRGTKPRGDESVETWGRRVLGRAATQWLVGAVLQGIYASPPDALAARAIFGGHRIRGKLAAPPRGMGELVDRLRAALEGRGARFQLGATVSALEPGIPTVVCTDAPAAARLVAPHAPALAEAIGRIRMTSLTTATAFYAPHAADTRGFGILFPRGLGITALGVLFNSDMFTGRSAIRSETWIYGDPDPNVVATIRSRLADQVRADRRALTGRDEAPVAFYPSAGIARLPIYGTPVLEAAARMGDLPPWLQLCGNYLGRLGVSAIVDTAASLKTKR